MNTDLVEFSTSTKALLVHQQRWFYLGSLGLAFCLAGTSAFLGTQTHTSTRAFGLSMDEGLLVSYVASLLLLVCVTAAPQTFHRLRTKAYVLVLVAIVMTAGLALLVLGAELGLPATSANVLGGALLGASSMLLLLFWIDFLVPSGTRATLLCFGLAVLGAAIVCVVLISLGPVPGAILALALPGLSCAFFIASAHSQGSLAEDDGRVPPCGVNRQPA